MVLILNFSGHELTRGVRADIEALVGEAIDVRELSRQLDLAALERDVADLVDSAGVSREVWQEEKILVMAPTLGAAAAVLCAHVHGLTGAFPRLLWLTREPDTGTYTVPVLLDLPEVRTRGRLARFSDSEAR